MSRYRVCDVMVELAELCSDMVGEIRLELGYHRGSVYKHETAKKINDRVERLRVLFVILNDDLLLDLFADFDAMAESPGLHAAPGECTLTTRVSRLLNEAVPVLREFQRKMAHRRGVMSDDTIKMIAGHRRTLMAVCRQGSRSWELLKNI